MLFRSNQTLNYYNQTLNYYNQTLNYYNQTLNYYNLTLNYYNQTLNYYNPTSYCYLLGRETSNRQHQRKLSHAMQAEVLMQCKQKFFLTITTYSKATANTVTIQTYTKMYMITNKVYIL